MFVGYPFGKKGYKVYDRDRNEFVISRDVVFREDVFPYATESVPAPKSAPTVPMEGSAED